MSYSTGYDHTCAVISGGDVKCWGWNNRAQLGSSVGSQSKVPVSVTNLDGIGVAVACGYQHSCAIVSGGGVKCWGENDRGQLGIGVLRGQKYVPVDVVNLSGPAVAIDVGNYHNCVIISGGTMQCWGYNNTGQIGDGTITWRTSPTSVQNLSGAAVALSVGINYTCALISGGSLQCWGSNGYGNLGDGTNHHKYLPVDTVGLAQTTAVSAGFYHTCAVDSGEVKCWGSNISGELGDGTYKSPNVFTPQSVLF